MAKDAFTIFGWYRDLSDREKEQIDRLARQLRLMGSTGVTARDGARRISRFR